MAYQKIRKQLIKDLSLNHTIVDTAVNNDLFPDIASGINLLFSRKSKLFENEAKKLMFLTDWYATAFKLYPIIKIKIPQVLFEPVVLLHDKEKFCKILFS